MGWYLLDPISECGKLSVFCFYLYFNDDSLSFLKEELVPASLSFANQ